VMVTHAESRGVNGAKDGWSWSGRGGGH